MNHPVIYGYINVKLFRSCFYRQQLTRFVSNVNLSLFGLPCIKSLYFREFFNSVLWEVALLVIMDHMQF